MAGDGLVHYCFAAKDHDRAWQGLILFTLAQKFACYELVGERDNEGTI